jgi:hypothetical protein
MSKTNWCHGAASSALLLCGCTVAELAPVPPPDLRIVVTTKNEYMSAGEAMMRTSHVARVPTREVMEVAPFRFQMILVCPDEATCRDAVARLRADHFFVAGVDVDRRRAQIPANPTREMSR